MSKSKTKDNIYVADFETTLTREKTEVWASALVKIGTEDVIIHNNIDDFFHDLLMSKESMIIYFHNLKFDGSFILDYLCRDSRFTQAFDTDINKFKENKEMTNGEFKYLISDMGAWYSITLRWANHYIIFRDSLKLLNFSVSKIGKDFNTKHQKLEIDYTTHLHANEELSNDEIKYISNDVLVVAEALEQLFKKGYNKLTIASCALYEYKRSRMFIWDNFRKFFPRLDEIPYPYGNTFKNADDFIRQAYRGGWCYCVEEKENIEYKNGITLDVNSLYPSVMSDESNNVYPVGKPHWWQGNYIPKEAQDDRHYYFLRIKTRFYIRANHLPTIQIKRGFFYSPTSYLRTSDACIDGEYYSKYYDEGGQEYNTIQDMIVTCEDYKLMQEQYYLVDTEIIEGCYFTAYKDIFSEYIEKFRSMKLNAKNSTERSIAKLFLNSLYGKFGTNQNSSFKTVYINEDNHLAFRTINELNQEPVFVAVAAAVTSYARSFTIRAAQANYPYFIYADTDSLHLNCDVSKVNGITLHDKNFLSWKCEQTWDKAIFVRQKTYIEHDVNEGYIIKCAGMGKRCKELLIANLDRKEIETFSGEEREFMKNKLDLKDFKRGLKVPSKLYQRRVQGGVVLYEDYFKIH